MKKLGGLATRGNRFKESEETYDTEKSVSSPKVGGATIPGPKSTPRRGSGAQTKARFAKGPMG